MNINKKLVWAFSLGILITIGGFYFTETIHATEDTTRPEFVSATTADANGDGTVDQLTIFFSELVTINHDDDSANPKGRGNFVGFVLEGGEGCTDSMDYEITTDNIDTFTVGLTGCPSGNTAVTVDLHYESPGALIGIFDLAGNEMSENAEITPTVMGTDGVGPYIYGAATGTGSITVAFSEGISTGSKNPADFILSGFQTNPVVTGISSDDGDDTLILDIDNEIGTGELGSINLRAAGVVSDITGNPSTQTSPVAFIDGIQPTVVVTVSQPSIRVSDNGATFDVILTFSELMDIGANPVVVFSEDVMGILTSPIGEWPESDVETQSGDTYILHYLINTTTGFDSSVDVTVTDAADYNSNGVMDPFTATALFSIDTILEANQTDAGSGATLDATHTEAVVSSALTSTTITIPAGVTNGTINVSDLVTDLIAVLPQITINAVTSIGTVNVVIPASVTVTGDAGWTGVINVPTVQANSSVSGVNGTVQSVVEVGFGDIALTFDRGVRLNMAGQAGRSAGYSRNGVFTEITGTCSADTQATGDALPAGGDCKINVGSDLVIWTQHFTSFVSFTTPTVKTGGGGGGGGSSPAVAQPILDPVIVSPLIPDPIISEALPAECRFGDLFSPLTGKACPAIPQGCTAFTNYSPLTGALCPIPMISPVVSTVAIQATQLQSLITAQLQNLPNTQIAVARIPAPSVTPKKPAVATNIIKEPIAPPVLAVDKPQGFSPSVVTPKTPSSPFAANISGAAAAKAPGFFGRVWSFFFGK